MISILTLPCGWHSCLAVCWSLDISAFNQLIMWFLHCLMVHALLNNWHFNFSSFFTHFTSQACTHACTHTHTHTSFPLINPLFLWRCGNPFIRDSITLHLQCHKGCYIIPLFYRRIYKKIKQFIMVQSTNQEVLYIDYLVLRWSKEIHTH